MLDEDFSVLQIVTSELAASEGDDISPAPINSAVNSCAISRYVLDEAQCCLSMSRIVINELAASGGDEIFPARINSTVKCKPASDEHLDEVSGSIGILSSIKVLD